MGIMYLIWDDTIYSATYRYRPRPYKHAACRTVKGCSTTLRHRDHVHISLTWKAARGNTSWYAGKTTRAPEPRQDRKPKRRPSPRPVPKPVPRWSYLPSRTDLLSTRVRTDGGEVHTSKGLVAGREYKLTVFGLYRFGESHTQVADAACVWNPKVGEWAPRPGRARGERGSLNLLVNDRRVLGESCRADHVYQVRWTPRRAGPVTFRVDNATFVGSGDLTVVASAWGAPARRLAPKHPRPAAAPVAGGELVSDRVTLREFVRVPASGAVVSSSTLQAGVAYKVTVSGAVQLAPGVFSDGQCLSLGGRWEQAGSLDLRSPGARHGRLFVDGVEFDGVAPVEDFTGCSTHVHSMVFTPARTSRVQFAVWDPFGSAGNVGELEVVVSRVSPVPAPSADRPGGVSSKRDRVRGDRFGLSASAPEGTLSRVSYAAGDRVRVRVWGSYTVADWGSAADASCVASYRGWVPSAESDTGQDLFGVAVNGASVPWSPVRWHHRHGWRADGRGSCSSSHAYSATVTVDRDGPVRVGVFDLEFRDNAGSVVVETELVS